MPTVEKVVAPLPAGVRIGDPADPVAVTLKEVLTTVLQQDGCQQARFGTQIENPQNLELLISKPPASSLTPTLTSCKKMQGGRDVQCQY